MKVCLPVVMTALCATVALVQCAKEPPRHTNIVLLGATGDLAKRYLWKSLFDLFKQNYIHGKNHFSIYGCSRKSADEGRQLLSEILLNVIRCVEQKCRDIKTKFVQAVQFHPLKTEKDYQFLADKIEDNTRAIYALSDNSRSYEEGRLFYLSIPPSVYGATAKLIHKYLLPRAGRPWVRLAVEKPFGHDSESAQKLLDQLYKYFHEDQIYRIDHYMGKTVVRQILPFRVQNSGNYDHLWNRHYIERVEIVAKEVISVKGRLAFYDSVGVIKDMLQNHLTEMLQLVTMDLPENSGNITEIQMKKARVLLQVQPVSQKSTLIGQYNTYVNESQSELGKKDYISKTPTFAATLLQVDSARWRGVPFILMTGKMLDEKATYIRVIFKDNHFCLGEHESCTKTGKEIIFNIASSDIVKLPMILVSKALGEPVLSKGWTLSNHLKEKSLFGLDGSKMHVLIPTEEQGSAYTELVQAMYQGLRHMFVDAPRLLASWKIWTPLLNSLNDIQPQLYSPGQEGVQPLNFLITGNGLEYIKKQKVSMIHIPDVSAHPVFGHIPGQYRGQGLVVGDTDEVTAKLAGDIAGVAAAAVSERGTFHLALSGGTSPLRLLEHWVTSPVPFPWENTHVWLVDERCVPLDSANSNLHMLSQHLLGMVQVPYHNIHPMPVQLKGDLCDQADRGDEIYEAAIKRVITNASMDYILLGVGSDGHTASLFPGQPSLEVSDKYVTYASGGPSDVSTERMTLTLPLINRAKHVAVLVTGENKHDIVHELSGGLINPLQYPITGVVLPAGNLVWYIDRQAWSTQ